MPLTKAIPIALGVILALTTLLFVAVPASRPAMVDRWFKAARGYSPAKSAEDAMDQFKRAIERRDYDAAADYLTGDYLEFFRKGMDDAKALADEAYDMTSVMKTTGVKSDKVDVLLFWINPFPPFKYDVAKSRDPKGTVATIHWNEDAARLRDGLSKIATEQYRVEPKVFHGLLPTGTAIPVQINVAVKEVNGAWKIEMPVSYGDRHLRDTVEALRKNATNYRNAIRDVKNNIKNNPAVKEDFEREFKSNLEKAN